MNNRTKKPITFMRIKPSRYMVMTANNSIKIDRRKKTIGYYSFERRSKFYYLCSLLNSENTVTDKICKRIIEGSKIYYTNRPLMKALFLSRNTKVKLYKTLIAFGFLRY